MKQLLDAIEDHGFKDYGMMDRVDKTEAQDFVDWLAEYDLVNTTKVRVLDKMDADYFGHAQHIENDGVTYHLVTLLTPVTIVLVHEVAHLLVYKADPEFSKNHQNEHGPLFDAGLIRCYGLWVQFKEAVRALRAAA